jgi:hypothetical protein
MKKMGFHLATLSLFISFGVIASDCYARVFLTWDEAVASAFNGCQTETQRLFLTEKQLVKAKEISRLPDIGAVWTRIRAVCPLEPKIRFAYSDTHRVRTQNESLMIVIAADRSIERIEVLSFDEPAEFMPKSVWYDRFKKQKLTEELTERRSIPHISGASLTTRSTIQSARRVLAVHEAYDTVDPAGK